MREDYNENDDRYEDEYDDYGQEQVDNKAVRGYRIVIIILAVILVALSVVYFNMHRQQQAEYALLEEDRTKIQGDLDSLIVSFDDLKIQNDSIAANLEEANQLMEQLKNERRLNYAKIRAYEKEVGTLRTVMQGYIRQIDSLNNINQQLTRENISYKKEISTAQLRAEMAEERAEELNNRVRGSCYPRPQHHDAGSEQSRQGGYAREERTAPLPRLCVGSQRVGRAGQQGYLRLRDFA